MPIIRSSSLVSTIRAIRRFPNIFGHSRAVCSYTSYSQDYETKYNLMKAALRHVPQVGWTDEALVLGGQEIGLSPITIGVLETSGPLDLVHYFLKQKRLDVQKIMTEKSEASSQQEASSENPLFTAISLHLDILEPYRTNWPSAIALLLNPSHAMISAPILYDTIDDFCHYASLSSVKLDWYTDRVLLLFVYSVTELYMLTDESPGLQDTKNFLRRILVTYEAMRKNPSGAAAVRDAVQEAIYQLSMNRSR